MAVADQLLNALSKLVELKAKRIAVAARIRASDCSLRLPTFADHELSAARKPRLRRVLATALNVARCPALSAHRFTAASIARETGESSCMALSRVRRSSPAVSMIAAQLCQPRDSLRFCESEATCVIALRASIMAKATADQLLNAASSFACMSAAIVRENIA